MYVIADSRIPAKALDKLSSFALVLLFSSNNVTYDEISGHPDIFFCQIDNQLIAAPNTPAGFLKKLDKYNIPYSFGESQVGVEKINSTHYNAVVTQSYLIHNTKVTEKSIVDLCTDKTIIHCNQGYTRCSLIAPDDNLMITSDGGISKILSEKGIEHLLIGAKEILLPGFANGFFGGTCGFFENTLFLMGNLNFHPEGETIRKYVYSKGFDIVELYDGPLFDGGSLLFIN